MPKPHDPQPPRDLAVRQRGEKPDHEANQNDAAVETDVEDSPVVLSKDEQETAAKQTEPSAPVVFEIVRRDGERELQRPAHSIWFSGVAAGLAMGFSVLAQALAHEALPAAPWAGAIEKLGYCVGFILVISARLQLFTENTITAVVPVMLKPNRRSFARTLNLWTVVLGANVLGAILFAAFFRLTQVRDEALYQAMLEISRHAVGFEPLELIARGTVAGFLIAMLVWIMASRESGHLWLIILITYVVALGDFAHVIAGSVEAALLALSGEAAIIPLMTKFFLPTLAGNVIGGSLIFTMLVYAQIRHEIDQ